MKKLIFVMCSMMFAVTVNGQDIKESEVPSVVLNTFKQQFPKAVDVEWEMKATLYKVEFEIGRDDHEVWLEKTGKIVKHKEEIPNGKLPQEVMATINKDFKGYRVDEAEKIDNAGIVTYKVELKKASSEMKVVFDNTGKIISQKAD